MSNIVTNSQFIKNLRNIAAKDKSSPPNCSSANPEKLAAKQVTAATINLKASLSNIQTTHPQSILRKLWQNHPKT